MEQPPGHQKEYTRGNRKYPEISREKQIDRKKERKRVRCTDKNTTKNTPKQPPKQKKKKKQPPFEDAVGFKENEFISYYDTLFSRRTDGLVYNRAPQTHRKPASSSRVCGTGRERDNPLPHPRSVVASLIANPSLHLKPGPAHLSVRPSVLPSIQQRRRDPPVAFALSILPRFPLPFFLISLF